MCTEYRIDTSSTDVSKALGEPVLNAKREIVWEKVVTPWTSSTAPLLQLDYRSKDDDEGKLKLVDRIFPKAPLPNARLSGLEGQTDGGDSRIRGDDVQIRRLYEPTPKLKKLGKWAAGFTEDPFAVVMTDFREFVYWGKNAGSVLSFKIPGEDVLFAAGIGFKPAHSESDERTAFALLTHTATPQMWMNHHRLIVLLKAKYVRKYLSRMTAQERYEFLLKYRYTGKLEIAKVRNMASGWKTRIDDQLRKKSEEARFRATLKREQVAG